MTLSPIRSSSSQRHAPSASSTTPASAASPRLGEGTAIRSRVVARRSPTGSGAGTVVTQDLVQLRLVVAFPFAQALDDQHAGNEELATGILAPAAGPDGDAPRRDDAAGDLLPRLG